MQKKFKGLVIVKNIKQINKSVYTYKTNKGQ